MKYYRKLVAAVVGGVALSLAAFFGIGDGTALFGIPVDTAVTVVLSVLTAFGVYQVPNETQ